MSKFELLAVAGNPILHSVSPNIFNSQFNSINKNAYYSRIAANSAKEVIELSNDLGLKGLNITAPFKEDILEFVDNIDEHCLNIGATNTIRFENGKSFSTNTDYFGVIESLKSVNTEIKGKNVVVLGAGGASKASIYGLKKENANITIVNRTVKKGENLAKKFNCEFIPLSEINNCLKNADILISTLPQIDFDLKKLNFKKSLTILDGNYKNSKFDEFAKNNNLKFVSGLNWLIWQAFKGYEFIFSELPDFEAMKKGALTKINNDKFKNISLCGFMASGKSLIGSSLSKLTNLNFKDLDKLIEEQEQCSISEIFETKGEEYFREVEKKVLNKVFENKNQLISLGGGSVLSTQNRTKIKNNSISVWLYSNIQSTVERIEDSSRPLLKGENLEKKAREKLKERIEFYGKTSDLILSTTNANRFNLEQFAEKLINEFENYEKTNKLVENSITIHPSTINGEINSPTSKSFTQRMIAIACLTKGKTEIFNPIYCDDVIAALNIAENLGIKVNKSNNSIKLENNGIMTPKSNKINVMEAGLSLRMFSAIIPHFKGKFKISGHGSILTRPISMIEKPLKQLGVKISSNNGLLPLEIEGPLESGIVNIDGSTSSQFLTGLLISLPFLKNDSIIKVDNLKSKPYIDLTLSLMKKANILIENQDYKLFKIRGNQQYKPISVKSEGDWSGAAFLLCAGAINGNVKVSDLNINSTQGDKDILKALKQTEANVEIEDFSISVSKKENLKPFQFDATNCPDLFPPLVALAANCNGISEIKGVGRLKHKESNRGEVLKEEFGKLGIEIILDNDNMIVKGDKIKGNIVNSHNDHRIAMALALASLNSSEKVIIKNKSCINKSYPDFYKDLKTLGVTINE